MFSQPALPELHPIPNGYARVHVFWGDFDSENDALAYCHGTGQENNPAPLTRDMPDAFIDPTFVEINRDADIKSVLQWLDRDGKVETNVDASAMGNTLILIYEDAFGGLPYRLGYTDRVAYAAAWLIRKRK